MTLLDQLRQLSFAYAEARKLSMGRVSTLVFGDGMKLPAIFDNSADITTTRYEKAVKWYSDNWPAGVEWPSGIIRPAPDERPPDAQRGAA